MDFIKNELKSLFELMKREVKLYSSLVRLEKEKMTGILDDNIMIVSEVSTKETLVLEKVNIVEKGRKNIVERLRENFFPDRDKLSLREITGKYTDYRSELRMEAMKLGKVIAEVTFLNNLNKRMISDHISFINLTLRAFKKKDDSSVYNVNGKSHSTDEKTLYNLSA